MNNLISVIISTKNNQATLRYTLLSTLKLVDLFNVELIIVDGRSTDRTPEIIAEFMSKYKNCYRNFKVLQDPGSSLSLARRLGYEKSEGSVIIFLDGDTPLTSTFAFHLKEELEDCDLISPSFKVVPLDGSTRYFGRFLYLITELENYGKTIFKPSLLPPARIFKRRVLEKMHGYPLFSKFFGEDRAATSFAVALGFRYKYSTRLELLKIDEPGYSSYFKKHLRYGLGIHRDLTLLGKRFLRDYIVVRRLNHVNILVPIISYLYALEYLKMTKDIETSLHIAMIKYLIDIAMFLGDISGSGYAFEK